VWVCMESLGHGYATLWFYVEWGGRRGRVGSRHGSSSFVTAIFDEGDGLKKSPFS